MSIDRDRLRWNGWGYRDRAFRLSPEQLSALVASLGARFGRPLVPGAPAAGLDGVQVPASRANSALLDRLSDVLAARDIRTSPRERALHAAGKSLPDLLRLRSGRLERAPDAVVYPRDPASVQRLLALAAELELAIVPFGGGTSVVGGVEPLLPEGKRALIALDTTELDRLLGFDRASSTATLQAGIDGPALEAALGEHGHTLGHFPQSFEHSTLGGWIATRSSGQQSDGYGGIDDMLVSARMLCPGGELQTLTVPRHASGPDLRELILGSEGALGVIVEATLRVRPAPAHHAVHGALFRDFAAGVDAVRELAGSGLPLTMMRLSDGEETELSLLLRRDPARRFDPSAAFLSAARGLGYAGERSLLLFGIESEDPKLGAMQLLRAQAICLRQRALPLGSAPGRSWQKERFATPYLRDLLLDQGAAIDTLETAFEWKDLLSGHARVVAALRDAASEHAGAGIAMGHLSHSYPDGACVYFIVIYPPAQDDPVEQWRRIKRVATEAIMDAGGTLSHHHGVGTDHQPWLAREKGPLGMQALRAIKAALDPSGVMNPGKLL